VNVALIDDQPLGSVLRGRSPRFLASKKLFTTAHWYVRLCQAAVGAQQRAGVRSRQFVELPDAMRARALAAVLELPADVELLSLREVGPSIARLRQQHQLNILGIEALPAARHLQAGVYLSASSPRLEQPLRSANLKVGLQPPVRD